MLKYKILKKLFVFYCMFVCCVYGDIVLKCDKYKDVFKYR
jgi:hypothetical protein